MSCPSAPGASACHFKGPPWWRWARPHNPRIISLFWGSWLATWIPSLPLIPVGHVSNKGTGSWIRGWGYHLFFFFFLAGKGIILSVWVSCSLMNWLFAFVWMTIQRTPSNISLCVSLWLMHAHLSVNGIFQCDYFNMFNRNYQITGIPVLSGRRTEGKFKFRAKEKFSQLRGDQLVPLLHSC